MRMYETIIIINGTKNANVKMTNVVIILLRSKRKILTKVRHVPIAHVNEIDAYIGFRDKLK